MELVICVLVVAGVWRTSACLVSSDTESPRMGVKLVSGGRTTRAEPENFAALSSSFRLFQSGYNLSIWFRCIIDRELSLSQLIKPLSFVCIMVSILFYNDLLNFAAFGRFGYLFLGLKNRVSVHSPGLRHQVVILVL
jgi:hypothetical protein